MQASRLHCWKVWSAQRLLSKWPPMLPAPGAPQRVTLRWICSTNFPIVVSDLPALSEVVAPGERGLSFTPENPASLAAVVQPLLDDADLRARFGAAGRDWVTRERTWAANGRRYLEAYGRLGVRPMEVPS